jgi:hypothetical protein
MTPRPSAESVSSPPPVPRRARSLSAAPKAQ